MELICVTYFNIYVNMKKKKLSAESDFQFRVSEFCLYTVSLVDDGLCFFCFSFYDWFNFFFSFMLLIII